MIVEQRHHLFLLSLHFLTSTSCFAIGSFGGNPRGRNLTFLQRVALDVVMDEVGVLETGPTRWNAAKTPVFPQIKIPKLQFFPKSKSQNSRIREVLLSPFLDN